MGTFGRISLSDFECYTCEPPWLDNRPFASCIPEGDYAYERDIFDRHKGKVDYETFGLVMVPDRSHILFHIGNDKDDTAGCILPGLGLGVSSDGLWAVTKSTQAFLILRDKLAKQRSKMIQVIGRCWSTT